MALALWRGTGLEALCERLLPLGKERIAWSKMAAVLVAARFCEPSSELHIAEDWYRRTALSDLLQLDDEEVNKDRLYRGLDHLLAYSELEAHLSQRCGELFAIQNEVLLYDVTSEHNIDLWMLGLNRFEDSIHVTCGAHPGLVFFGHLAGDYVHNHQPAKFAAIEGRWHDEQPAGEVLIAIPDPTTEANLYELKIPVLGSLIGSMSFSSKEVGLTDFPPQDRPPRAHPVLRLPDHGGLRSGHARAGLAWYLSVTRRPGRLSLNNRLERLSVNHRLESNRLLLWLIFLSFPLPFVAIITGWYTAEVGRQPWVVYGVLRTAEAMTPFLTAREATISLVVFFAVYAFIFLFGTFPHDWCRRRNRDRDRAQHSPSQRPLAVLHGRSDLRVGLRHSRAVLLALHHPLRHHRR
ncbi:MAG: cytochrome ubiquinol oxidase subunit [Bradyrhizobium sp.]|nr:cytochrome ubiquinol oxidase subunit [Bradyrhizobium sp.]